MLFEGYLFAACDANFRPVAVFPNKYIQYNSWSSTPNQREEIKAYRDDNTRNLTRITAAGKKSVFSFKVRSSLHLEDKIEIQAFFTNNELDHEQRKINLKFWDDENNEYKTGTFYRPNMPFPIIKITDDDIIYGELTIECIEY
jgi:fructose-1,6-bisphosphatase